MKSNQSRYDWVIMTHLPSFYKVNLYEAISKNERVFVIFVGEFSDIRTKDFVQSDMTFDHVFLSKGPFERRSSIKTCIRLRKILKNLNYSSLLVGGWDLIEFWYAISFFHSKSKNCLALESGEESNMQGLRGFMKKLFLGRISRVFASGRKHKSLLNSLGYKGQVHLTRGVGLSRFTESFKVDQKNENKKRCLYIGRLAEEKNLLFLINAFRGLNYRLTIVGNGPLEQNLKKAAPENVNFISHVPHEDISKLYLTHDLFILPSLREPWGLVVEEALHYQLPVLVSNRVGCSPELVEDYSTGLTFDPTSKKDFLDKLESMLEAKSLDSYRKNVMNFDLDQLRENQVKVYSIQ